MIGAAHAGAVGGALPRDDVECVAAARVEGRWRRRRRVAADGGDDGDFTGARCGAATVRDEDGADTHTLIEGCRQPKKLIAVYRVVLFEPSVGVALDDAGGFGLAPNRVGAAGGGSDEDALRSCCEACQSR